MDNLCYPPSALAVQCAALRWGVSRALLDLHRHTVSPRALQLGNNGGNLVLQDDQANHVDSATYSAADAAVVDR